MSNREKYYYPKIYCLICPIENKVRYVGLTKRYLSERLWSHCNKKKQGNKRKSEWIKLLKSSDLVPEIKLLETPISEIAVEREKFWIKHFGRENLLNMNDGDNKPPPMAGWNKKIFSQEIIDKMGTMPDYKLAKIADTNKTTIARNRKTLGIKSYAEQTGNNGHFKKRR